jgi:hypothetical protein
MIPMCKWCGSDLYVDDYDEASDIATCLGPGHPEPRMFEPKAEQAHAKAKELQLMEGGIASELGLYTDLPKLLSYGEYVDTNVVEYRYGIAHPQEYAWMLDRWGHVA